MSREEWFRTLNAMFWVFSDEAVNHGVVRHLRDASPNRTLSRVVLHTRGLTADFIEQRIRLSAINGGGSNGASPRGSATYKPPSLWTHGWPPREIGILD